MSHELTIRKSGHVEMAYVGSTPWHGLGQKLEENTSIEEWQRAAGMDWRIQRSKVRYAVDRDGTDIRTIDDKHVLFRSDTKADLGTVSDGYKVVQPGAVLEFFRDLTESAGFRLETAGTMFGGRRFWALAATGESAAIADPRDRVNGYLLLSTSCDGSMATEGRYTNVRVVCHNTLSMANANVAKVRVTHRSVFDAAKTKKELGVGAAHDAFASAMDELRRLSETPVMPTDVLMQTAALFNPKSYDMAKEELNKVLELKAVRRIGELALGQAIGGGMKGTTGTQWGWLNAVTQYVDHEARARSQDNRLNSAWFGAGDDLKTRAYNMARAALV